MKVLDHRVEPDGVVLTTSTGPLKVQAIGERVLRVVLTGREVFSPAPSLVLVEDLERTAPAVEETSNELVLSTARLVLRVDRASGAFTWTDADGGLLVREPRDGAETKVLEPVDVVRTVFDEDTERSVVSTPDGDRTIVGQGRRVVDRQAYATTVRLELVDGEAIYGLGQHERGVLDHRGDVEHLYQQNMKIVAPMIVSSRGWAMLWDSTSLATFRDDADGTSFRTEVDDELDVLVIAGPELDDVVGEVRRLTGPAPMPPRWALGYVQSKDRYASSAELLDVVEGFRERGFPLDCIVQDWQSWPPGVWGQKSFDPARYPDPTALTAALHGRGVALMVSIWPNLHGDSPDRREMIAAGHLLGDESTYDAFDPVARATYWRQTREGYADHGVDAFWADCTEPFEGDWHGASEPSAEQRVDINVGQMTKYLDPERINAYSLLHSRGLYEGQRADVPGKRVLTLTRSGFVGQQRCGAVTWSGDTSATWWDYRRQIADGLNLAVTGTPWWTVDVGAYFVTPGEEWFWRGDFPDGVDDAGYRELYVRWFQLGAFLPMFRSHGRDAPREPWRFGDPGVSDDVGGSAYDTLVAFARLRYRLLPYLYSLAGWTTHRGYTPMRSLVFDFRHDPATHRVDDQFMLGPALLVAPVTHPVWFGPGSTPLTGTSASRPVYLPAGCDWYDFWTGQRHAGGRSVEAAAPLERIPLFVRAGSVLPLGPDVQHTGQDPYGDLEVRVYPGADGAFDLYDDAGDGYGYEDGEAAWTPLRWDDAAGELVVGERAGSFPGTPSERGIALVVVDAATGAGTGAGSSAEGPRVRYLGAPVTVR